MGMSVSGGWGGGHRVRRVRSERCGGTPKASLNASAKCSAETWLTRANRCTGQASCEAASIRSFARSRRRSSSGSWLVDVTLPKTVRSESVTQKPAIHRNALTGDVSRRGQAQEGDGGSDLFGFADAAHRRAQQHFRSEEHTSELQSLMRISYAVLCLKKN